MYFIIENHTRSDDSITTETVSRQSFASALSYYHERFSKMCVTELYKSVSILLTDKDLNIIQHDIIETQFKLS